MWRRRKLDIERRKKEKRRINIEMSTYDVYVLIYRYTSYRET